MLQRAFDQGREYAAQQLAQKMAEESETRQQQLDGMTRSNEAHEAELRVRIEELQRREYRCASRRDGPAAARSTTPVLISHRFCGAPHRRRAPVTPLGCKEEREAALLCYKSVRGAKPGEIVTQCQQVTDELDKCAALVREAAMSKIIKGAVTQS